MRCQNGEVHSGVAYIADEISEIMDYDAVL